MDDDACREASILLQIALVELANHGHEQSRALTIAQRCVRLTRSMLTNACPPSPINADTLRRAQELRDTYEL